MDIQINNILSLTLTNDDVNSFIEIFGTLKNNIHQEDKKVGFKTNNKVTLELTDGIIEFIQTLCDSAGILSETEIKEQENSNPE